MAIQRGRDGPGRKRVRRDGWTKDRRARMLDSVAATANVSFACRSVGMSQTGLWALCRREPHFRSLVLQAREQGYERLEAELLARAMGAPSDDDPTDDDRQPLEALPDFDPALALNLLQMRAAVERRERSQSRLKITRATQAEVDAELLKRLAAIGRKLRAQHEADHGDDPAALRVATLQAIDIALDVPGS